MSLGVAGQKFEARDGCVRADIEVGQRRRAQAAASSIFDEGPYGDETGLAGERQPPKCFNAYPLIQLRHGGEARCQFRIDDRIDSDIVVVGGLSERGLRSGPPCRISREHIDNDVRIDEDHRGAPSPLFRAGTAHKGDYFVRRHFEVAAAAKRVDQLVATGLAPSIAYALH
jgi:hypothetical protein